MALTCLQIHNDYQIPGGETKTAVGIGNVLEKNGIKVIRYYKTNNSFRNGSFIAKVRTGIKSIYNFETVAEIQKIINENEIDFALVHNVIPMISNSVYDVLERNNIPIIKYLQNYNLVCLNGALDCGENCVKCRNNNLIGVFKKCYKRSSVYSMIKYIIKKDLDKKYLDKFSAFMANSKYVMNKHLEFNVGRDKMCVMYNYINPYRNKSSPNRENDYYLYFGRITREKGVFTVLAASKSFLNRKFVFMGSGEELDELVKASSDCPNVTCLGNKQGEEMIRIIMDARAVIVSSEWDEPLPRTILEAYTVGTPVIGTDRGGIPEMIKPHTGFVYKGGDVEDLIKKIKKMEELNSNNYFQMRINCINEIIENYTETKYMERFHNCLKQIGIEY